MARTKDYSDARKYGTPGWRQLQQINNQLYQDALRRVLKGGYQLPSFLAPRESPFKYFSRQPIASPILTKSGGTDWSGKSYWDPETYSLDEFNSMRDNPNEIRAYNQPGIVLLANGLMKMLGLAGSTFLNSTIGLVAGLILGTANKIGGGSFWEGMWNNAVTAGLEEFNKSMEEWMPNYYSQKELEGPWYENLFTANFIGDKLLKNMGFTIGAMGAAMLTGGLGTGAGVTAGLTRLGLSATAAKTAGGIANRIVGGLISAAGEASIEAYNSVHDGMEKYENELDLYYKTEAQNLKDKYLQNIDSGISPDIAQLELNQGLELLESNVNKSMQEYMKTTTDNGNAVFGLNMALLTVSNNLEFGRIMKGGWGTLKALEQAYKKGSKEVARTIEGKIIGNTAADDVAFGKAIARGTAGYKNIAEEPSKGLLVTGAIKNSLTEGGEEGSLNLISTAAQMLALAKALKASRENGYLDYKLDPKITENLVNYTDALGKAWDENFGTAASRGWEEVALGALTGILGVPMIGRRKNGKVGLTWQGGFMEDYKDAKESYERVDKAVDELNKTIDPNKLKKLFHRTVANVAINQRLRQALFEDDHFLFKNNQLAGAVNTALGIRDGLDSGEAYRAMIEEMATNVTDKDVEEYKSAVIAETGNEDAFKGKTTEEIKQLLQTDFQKFNVLLNKSLDNYDKLSKDKNAKKLDETAFEELLYSYSLAQNMEDRIALIHEENAKLNADDPVDRKQIEKNNRDLSRLEEDKTFLNKRVENALNNPEEFNKLISQKLFNYLKAQIANDLKVQVEAIKNATSMENIAQVVAFLSEEDRESVLERAYNEGSDEVKQHIDNFRKFQDDADIVLVALGQAFDNLELELKTVISSTPEGLSMLRTLELMHINDKLNERGDVDEEYTAEQQLKDLEDFDPISTDVEKLLQLEERRLTLIEYINDEEAGFTDDQKVALIQNVNAISSAEDLLINLIQQKNSIGDLITALYQDIVLRDSIGEQTSIADGIRQTIDTLERDLTLDQNTKDVLLSALDELLDNEKLQGIKDIIKKRKDELEKKRREKEKREKEEAERKEKEKKNKEDKEQKDNKSEETTPLSNSKSGVTKHTVTSLLDFVNDTAEPKLTLTDNVLKSGLEIIVGDKSADRNADFPNGEAVTNAWNSLKQLNIVRKAFDPNSKYSEASRNNIKDFVKQLLEAVDKGFVIYDDNVQTFLELLNIAMNDEMLQWFTNYKATNKPDNSNDKKEPVTPPTANVDMTTKPNDFSGNQFRVEYDMLELFKHILKPVDVNRWPVIKRMWEDGVRPQWFIDNVLGRIYSENPDIKVRFVSSGKDIIYLALKKDEIQKYLPETNNISILNTNDGEYIAIGTLGVLNNGNNKDIYTKLLDKLTKAFNDNESRNKFYVDTELFTQINNYLSGEFIYETPEHPQGEFNFLKDLLEASPLLPSDLTFLNITGNENEGIVNTKLINNKSENVYYKPETTSTGQLFVYILSGTPNVWIPVKLKTVSWNDVTRINRTGNSEGQENPYLKNSVWYKEEIREPIETLFEAADEADKIVAIAKLKDNLLLNKRETGDGYKYVVRYDENTGTVLVFKDKKWTIVNNADELEDYFATFNPRVNIKNSVLANNPQLYIDAGILLTDVKFLHTMKSTFYVKGLDENFNVVEGRADMSKDEKTEKSRNINEPLYINNKTFYIRDNGIFYADGTELTVEDAALVRELQAVQNFGLTFEDQKGRTYIISGNTVFEKSSRGYIKRDGNGKLKILNKFLEQQKKLLRKLNRENNSNIVSKIKNNRNLKYGNIIDLNVEGLKWTEEHGNVVTRDSSPIVNLGGRMVVVVDVNGVKVPFYLSTGAGGKKNVASGKWYPFFGISEDGWINKTTEDEINRYYDSDILKLIALELDLKIGDIRDDESIIKGRISGTHMDMINSEFEPAENKTPETINKVRKNIDSLKAKLEEATKEFKPSIAATTITTKKKRDTKGFKPLTAQSDLSLNNLEKNNDDLKKTINKLKDKYNSSYRKPIDDLALNAVLLDLQELSVEKDESLSSIKDKVHNIFHKHGLGKIGYNLNAFINPNEIYNPLIRKSNINNLGNSENNDNFASIKPRILAYVRASKTNDTYWEHIGQLLEMPVDYMDELSPDFIAEELEKKLKETLTPENIAQVAESSEEKTNEVIDNIINCH